MGRLADWGVPGGNSMLRVWALFLAELSAQMPASPFGHKENVPKMPAGALISPSLSAVDGLRYAARYAQLHRPQLSAEGRPVLLPDRATQGGRGLTMPAADELLPGARPVTQRMCGLARSRVSLTCMGASMLAQSSKNLKQWQCLHCDGTYTLRCRCTATTSF